MARGKKKQPAQSLFCAYSEKGRLCFPCITTLKVCYLRLYDTHFKKYFKICICKKVPGALQCSRTIVSHDKRGTLQSRMSHLYFYCNPLSILYDQCSGF